MNLIKSDKTYYIFLIANIFSAIRLFLIGFPAGLFLSFLMLLLFIPLIFLRFSLQMQLLRELI